MFDNTDETGTIVCSFCGKTQDQVKQIVAGPGVYICNECVDLCKQIIDDAVDAKTDDLSIENLPSPNQKIGRAHV